MADPGELDWDDLRYFLAAVEHQTLAGAARALNVEHTTIGRRISALERSLGAPLLLRGPDGLRLTPLGEHLAPLAREVERAVRAVQQAARGKKTLVRLAVPTGLTRLFTARLSELRRDHPELELEIASSARAVALDQGEADVALRVGPVTDPELVARKLCESGTSLYASAAYVERRGSPEDLDDLAGHDVIGYGENLAATPAAVWLAERTRNANVVVRSRDAQDMLSAALSGAGIAALPCLIGDTEPSLRRLTSAVIATRALSVVHRKEARLSPEVRAVIDFVTAVIEEHAAALSGRVPER